MDYQIVHITEEHIPSLREGVDSVVRERRYLSFVEGFSLDETAAFVRNSIEKGSPHFVAVVDSNVVGWCDVTPARGAVHARCGVLGMGVLASHRGQGIGSALIRTTLAAGPDAGFTRVELSVREDNHTAIALYKKAGFQVEGLRRRAAFLDGRYTNVVLMGLLYDETAPATNERSSTPVIVGDVFIRDLQSEEIEAVRCFLAANGWAHRVSDAVWFARLAANSQRIAVAVTDGVIVGFARALCDNVSNGYISMVAVAPEFRRRGIGRRLIQYIVRSDSQILWMLRAGRGSSAFWETLGFRQSASAMERERSGVSRTS